MNKFLKIEKLTKEIRKYKSIVKCHCTHTKKKKKGREREIKKEGREGGRRRGSTRSRQRSKWLHG